MACIIYSTETRLKYYTTGTSDHFRSFNSRLDQDYAKDVHSPPCYFQTPTKKVNI